MFISQSNCCEHAITNIAELFSTKGIVQENSYITRNSSHEEMSLSNIMELYIYPKSILYLLPYFEQIYHLKRNC